MAKLSSFTLTVQTGGSARAGGLPQWKINGFVQPFAEASGGCGVGETFTGSGSPNSHPHSLVLSGPSEGEWEIAGMSVTYREAGREWTVRFGPVRVDSGSDVNLYEDPPLVSFGV